MSKLNYNCKGLEVNSSFSEVQYEPNVSCFSQMCGPNPQCSERMYTSRKKICNETDFLSTKQYQNSNILSNLNLLNLI